MHRETPSHELVGQISQDPALLLCSAGPFPKKNYLQEIYYYQPDNGIDGLQSVSDLTFSMRINFNITKLNLLSIS